MPHPIILYDGVCGLCNRFVQFVLRRDRKVEFRFASLQGALAKSLLVRHGLDPSELDTVYVVPNGGIAGESVLCRSAAVVFVLHRLGGLWRVPAFALQVMPKFLRDGIYDAIAQRRYRIFGRTETCPLPRPEDRVRFLDL